MKHDLIYVPIEPLAERYTEQWYRNLPVLFAEHFNVRVIDGEPLQQVVKVGTFLDINSTVHYKSVQLAKIAALFDKGLVKPNTRFFFGDIEFWGIESVRLMADMNHISVRLVGFLHAASYTHGDAFEIAAPYQQFTEVGWIAAMDAVLVGSQYHKNAVLARRLAPMNQLHLADRIVVSGNPLFACDYSAYYKPKQNLVVLTNRFDLEKDPESTLRLFAKAKAAHPEWEFLVTTSRQTFTSNSPALLELAKDMERLGIISIRSGLTKAEYHQVLAQAKVMVSHSPEESFGYCAVEAMLYGCQPLLKNNASHPELVLQEGSFLFSTEEEALAKLYSLMANPVGTTSYARRFLSEPINTFIKVLHDPK